MESIWLTHEVQPVQIIDRRSEHRLVYSDVSIWKRVGSQHPSLYVIVLRHVEILIELHFGKLAILDIFEVRSDLEEI